MTLMKTQLAFPWTSARITLAFGVAAAAPLVAGLITGGGSQLVSLALALVLAALWQTVFSRLRKRPMDWSVIVYALVFALLVPASVSLGQQAIALSFGLVFGVMVFGGRGRGFLNPVVVALSFLAISGAYLDVMQAGQSVAILAALAGVVLLWLGLLSWRLIAGYAVTLALMTAIWPLSSGLGTLIGASSVVGLVFLISDPAASAGTNAGRWAHGVLAAALVLLFAQNGTGDISLSAVVSAAFLASVFAPMVDQAVIWLNARRRARRAGQGSEARHDG